MTEETARASLAPMTTESERTSSSPVTIASGGASSSPVAVVTGASRGIGRAVALRLAEAGFRVVGVARSVEPLESLAEETGGWALPCDVTRPDDVAELAHAVQERAGRSPDLLVAAAGVFTLAPVVDLESSDLDLNLEVNLRAGILTVRHFLPGMLDRGKGTIVQVGSVSGRKAFPGNAAYSASKFGLRGFHSVLLEELRGTGVRATLLEPAATDTSIWDPMDPDGNPDLPGRAAMLRVEEVAEVVRFVATLPDGVQIPFLPVERS